MTHLYHRLAFHVAMAKTKFRRISDDPRSHDHRPPSGRRLGQGVGSLDQHRLGRGGGGALAAPLVLDRALAQHWPCARLPLVGHRAGRARDCSAGPPSFDCLLYGLDRAAPTRCAHRGRRCARRHLWHRRPGLCAERRHIDRHRCRRIPSVSRSAFSTPFCNDSTTASSARCGLMAAAPLSVSVDFTQKSTSCAPCTALPSVLAETRTYSSKVCVSSLSP